MPQRTFYPIVAERSQIPVKTVQGTMAQSETSRVRVLFQCDARHLEVPSGICITGNHDLLGNWKPNVVRMYDDGTHGDRAAADGLWSLEVLLPEGAEIRYKFTNSGEPGEWSPGEEFPGESRKFIVRGGEERMVVLTDTFGRM